MPRPGLGSPCVVVTARLLQPSQLSEELEWVAHSGGAARKGRGCPVQRCETTQPAEYQRHVCAEST